MINPEIFLRNWALLSEKFPQSSINPPPQCLPMQLGVNRGICFSRKWIDLRQWILPTFAVFVLRLTKVTWAASNQFGGMRPNVPNSFIISSWPAEAVFNHWASREAILLCFSVLKLISRRIDSVMRLTRESLTFFLSTWGHKQVRAWLTASSKIPPPGSVTESDKFSKFPLLLASFFPSQVLVVRLRPNRRIFEACVLPCWVTACSRQLWNG